MVRSGSSKGKYRIILEELNRFKKLVQGHKKLLNALGRS